LISIVFSILAFGALLLIGYFSRLHVMISANIYFSHIRISEFRRFLFLQMLLPAFLGNILIFIFKIPHQAEFQFLDSFVVLSVFILISGLFLNPSTLQSINFKHHKRTKEVVVLPVAIFFLAFAILRIGLSFGFAL